MQSRDSDLIYLAILGLHLPMVFALGKDNNCQEIKEKKTMKMYISQWNNWKPEPVVAAWSDYRFHWKGQSQRLNSIKPKVNIWARISFLPLTDHQKNAHAKKSRSLIWREFYMLAIPPLFRGWNINVAYFPIPHYDVQLLQILHAGHSPHYLGAEIYNVAYSPIPHCDVQLSVHEGVLMLKQCNQ